MKPAVLVGAAAILAAAATGIVSGRDLLWMVDTRLIHVVLPAAAEEVGAPSYYQDPDGRPSYSLTPKKTPDGRDYRAVPAGADISFDEERATKTGTALPADRKIRYYRNPMGLPDTSQTPKKDSMGMDYIPVYEGDDSDDGSVKLSLGKIQRTGVKCEPASKRVMRTLIRAPGTIALDERRVSVISLRSESFVLKVADVTTGSHVVKGQPLMEVYSPAVSSAAAEFLATITSKTTSGGDGSYGRGSRQRLMNLDVPEAAITAIEKSRNVPTSIEWTAPRDGIVLERNAIEGMRVQPGGVMFRVADHSLVWALIDVAERDLGVISIGQPATVKAKAFPDRDFSGKVGVIYPQINKETRTARIRVELPNPDWCCFRTCMPMPKSTPAAPSRSWPFPKARSSTPASRQVVFVDKGQGRFEPRAVQAWPSRRGYVEIRQGLADGDTVVVIRQLPDRCRKQPEGGAEWL